MSVNPADLHLENLLGYRPRDLDHMSLDELRPVENTLDKLDALLRPIMEEADRVLAAEATLYRDSRMLAQVSGLIGDLLADLRCKTAAEVRHSLESEDADAAARQVQP